MKKLSEIFKELTGQEQLGDKVVEFPRANFSVSLFKNEKKLVFAPIDNTKKTSVRGVINQIKDTGFRVKSAVPKDKGVWEVQLDQGENFNSVNDFIRQSADMQHI